MANALYDKGREKFLRGEISWNADDIKLMYVDAADYTLDLVNDEFHDDVPGAAIVDTSGNFSGKTTTAGVADADDVNVTNVTGDEFEYVVIFKDTGTSSTSPVIAVIDTATGLPMTPNGGDIPVEWDDGADKIFRL